MTSGQHASDRPAAARRAVGPTRWLARADFETFRAQYVSFSSPMPMRVGSPAPATARFSITLLGGIADPERLGRMGTALSETSTDAGFDVQGGMHPGSIVVRVLLHGASRVELNGRELPSPNVVIGHDRRIAMSLAPGSRSRSLVIPTARLVDALRVRLADDPAEPPRFDPLFRMRDPAVASWWSLANIWADPDHSRLYTCSPLALGHFEQVLVHTLLDAQPHSLSEFLNRHDRQMSPRALRRAVTYSEEHAHEPVSVADLAAAAGVSVRQLQRDFRAQLGTTPLEHLRRIRLDHAHHELLAVAQGRATGTVTEIAARWGFGHVGRFSEYYRGVYGRPPSHTLRTALDGPTVRPATP